MPPEPADQPAPDVPGKLLDLRQAGAEGAARASDPLADRQAPRVYWQTHETNSAAMKLYEKVADRSGFIVYRKNLT
ncbi:MAG: hypothetical protein VW405_07485 [Rhodospirillaceae bacterium]